MLRQHLSGGRTRITDYPITKWSCCLRPIRIADSPAKRRPSGRAVSDSTFSPSRRARDFFGAHPAAVTPPAHLCPVGRRCRHRFAVRVRRLRGDLRRRGRQCPRRLHPGIQGRVGVAEPARDGPHRRQGDPGGEPRTCDRVRRTRAGRSGTGRGRRQSARGHPVAPAGRTTRRRIGADRRIGSRREERSRASRRDSGRRSMQHGTLGNLGDRRLRYRDRGGHGSGNRDRRDSPTRRRRNDFGDTVDRAVGPVQQNPHRGNPGPGRLDLRHRAVTQAGRCGDLHRSRGTRGRRDSGGGFRPP